MVVFVFVIVFFFGQVMFPHHSDQMSQRSQVSRVTLLVCFLKGHSVSQWVTKSPIELSAGQLKILGQRQFKGVQSYQITSNHIWCIILARICWLWQLWSLHLPARYWNDLKLFTFVNLKISWRWFRFWRNHVNIVGWFKQLNSADKWSQPTR